MSSSSALTDFIAGCAGGVAQVLSGHPLDTLKVRLQTSGSGSGPQFNGMMDCLMKTIRSEGFFGLYKGMSSPLVGVSAINAVMFLNYGIANRLLRSEGDAEQLPMRKVFYSGIITGLGVSFVEGPFDLFKSKLQIQYSGQAKQYNNVFDVAVKLFKQRGVRALYQGLGATLVRNVCGNTAYFYFYELLKRRIAGAQNGGGGGGGGGGGKNVGFLPVLTAGGCAGIMYWVCCYPFDIIKSKMQTDAVMPSERRYRNMLDVLSQTLRKEGVAGMFRGVTPCLIRAFPANATCFLAYEYTKKALQGDR